MDEVKTHSQHHPRLNRDQLRKDQAAAGPWVNLSRSKLFEMIVEVVLTKATYRLDTLTA